MPVSPQLFRRRAVASILTQLTHVPVALVDVLPNVAPVTANFARVCPDFVTVRAQFTPLTSINSLR